MFSTPTIPTDSLYKFLFVGGIVLMLAAPYFYFKNSIEHFIVLSKIDSTHNYLEFRLDKESNRIKKLQNKLKDIQDIAITKVEYYKTEDIKLLNESIKSDKNNKDKSLNMRSKSLTENQNKEYSKINNVRDSLITDLDEIRNYQDSLHTIYETAKFKYNYEVSNYNAASLCLCFMFFIGLIMCISGLYYWFTKIQILQDKLLKTEVLERINKKEDNKEVFGRYHFEPKILPRKRR